MSRAHRPAPALAINPPKAAIPASSSPSANGSLPKKRSITDAPGCGTHAATYTTDMPTFSAAMVETVKPPNEGPTSTTSAGSSGSTARTAAADGSKVAPASTQGRSTVITAWPADSNGSTTGSISAGEPQAP